MSLLNNICTPALIYLIFALSQIIIDTYKRAYNIAFVKFIQMVVDDELVIFKKKKVVLEKEIEKLFPKFTVSVAIA